MAKQTRKQIILSFLAASPTFRSCAEITKHVALTEGLVPGTNVYTYLSGSVSSKLAAMVKKGEIRLSNLTTARGGNQYTSAI